MKKIKNSLSLFVILITAISIGSSTLNGVQAAPAVTITSPSNGQILTPGTITVSGTSTPNTSIQILQGEAQVGFTTSNGSGAWSTDVAGLSNGSHTLTARAIENGQYGYFGAAAGPGSFNVNRMRLSDNAFNPGGGGWPTSSTGIPMLPTFNASKPTTVNNKILFVNYTQQSSVPTMFNTSAPADPVSTTGYQSNAGARIATTNKNETKAYVVNNNSNNISVVNLSSNAQTATIALTAPQAIAWGPSSTLYVSSTTGSSTGKISIIDETTDTITDFFNVACTTTNSVGSLAFSNDQKYLYVACALDAKILKIKVSDKSLVSTIDLTTHSRSVIGPVMILPSGKMYVSGIYGVADGNKITVLNDDDSFASNITLTANAFAGLYSPDGKKFYVPTQGPFDGSVLNIDIIDTSSNAIVSNIDTSTVGIGYVFTFDPPVYATATVSVVLGSATASTNQPDAALAKTGGQISALVFGIVGLAAAATAYFIARRSQKYNSRRR